MKNKVIDRTILALDQAEKRSGSPMFAATYTALARFLRAQRRLRRTPAQIAAELQKSMPNPEKKNEPPALCGIRSVIEAFKEGRPITGFL